MQQLHSSAVEKTEEKAENGQGDAPPKQVALAMERLGQAARLIADIRLGADRLLESLLPTEDPPQPDNILKMIFKSEASMRQHLQDLQALGRQLEESGVLNESLRTRGDYWGLHMPLVCPDGAAVAYAWKRQLAGQAGASAVDRTRLALKAFTDQKKRFFPHLEAESADLGGDFGILKRRRVYQGLVASQMDNVDKHKGLYDLLSGIEKEAPYMKIYTYQRLDWYRRASSLVNGNPVDFSKEQNTHNKSKLGSLGLISEDQVAIIELLVPLVFRAVISLHPAGSTNPDSVAFFSPDEGGNYMHPRGFSVYHVYKHIKEHADKALQYFLGVKSDGALSLVLHWICNYQTLFTKACSKCGRLLSIDKQVGLLLPPVCRPYRQPSIMKHPAVQTSASLNEQISEQIPAYHIGCYSDET